MRLLSAIYLEKLHRYVFDNLYIQDYHINKDDGIVLGLYHLWCRLHPSFRETLLLYFGKCAKYERYYWSLKGFVRENNL